MEIFSTIITMISIVTTLFANRKRYKTVAKGRKSTVSGLWVGEYKQVDKLHTRSSYNPCATLTLKIKAGRKLIKGNMELKWDKKTGLNRIDKAKIKGGFIKEEFLEIFFQNSDPKVVQFGNILLELDPLGKRLSGKLQGFGPTRKGIVTGNVNLEQISLSKVK